MERERTYVCIDLKSFYASVECVRRGLDPMTTRLVVADPTRSEMTICLAVSPAMKAAGVKNRCRLYESPEGIDYITAEPRMNSYMEVSAEIYGTYLRYVSQEDIHPYSIDECFIDATPYLELYDLTAREFADTLRSAVLAETGIPATVGIGPNLFLAKVALDISAKHALDGVGELDARSFAREHLATSAHHRHLEHRAGHGSAAREVPGVRFEGRRRDGSGRALRRVRGERRVPASITPGAWSPAPSPRSRPTNRRAPP